MEGRVSAVHVAVIALSLLMTIGAWQFSKNQIATRSAAGFEVARDQALGLIAERMAKYEDALWAGVSTIQSHGGDVSRDQWRTFAETLRIDEKYPGISGIGVIHYLDEAEVPSYLAERRIERPDFRIHPEHLDPSFMPISFIEPEATNAAAVGLDVAHELNRRTAALASRDTGEAQITGPIFLVQDTGHTPGFLFYAPFYDGRVDTVSERQDRILGAVYAPFVVRKLMEGLLSKDLRDVRFSIDDGNHTIYDEHEPEDALTDPDPMFAERASLDLYGRKWTLDIRTNLAFRDSNTFAQPTIVLFAGLLIEALIIALLVLMSRANRQAISYADEVTDQLKLESSKLAEVNNELSTKNEELEQFVYVASHDLKTPIRGIAALTDMLEEDLAERPAAAGMTPDVALNLQRIRDRVRRMSDLTSGVMEFSRVGRHDGEDETLSLDAFMEEMMADFGLVDGQIALSGDVRSICFDTFNFRRVMENIVGNAIKYHQDVERLVITIRTESRADRCHVSISDNGPGIDPRFHGKIFQMFQTLRLGDAPESTGIGLAIVKKAVERHDGRITLTSLPGSGATFGFDWPHEAMGRSSNRTVEAA